MSRRSLFRLAGAAGIVTATTLSDARLALGAPGAAGTDVLVVLSLRGGFDGLSAVAPVGDPDYARARPTIATPATEAKRVDGLFRLHPAMAPLFPLWEAGALAAVHAVGQEVGSRSHFVATEALERATRGESAGGWIGRALVAADEERAAASVHVGSATLPTALTGSPPGVAMDRLGAVQMVVPEDLASLAGWEKAVQIMGKGPRGPLVEPLATGLAATGSLRRLAKERTDANKAGYPSGRLGAAMHDVARMIKADVGVRVAAVDFDGWDTHARQGAGKGVMAGRLAELSTALAAFAADLGPAMDRVTLVTLSEFGRRVAENRSGGTDHGAATAVLVMGGGIKGGQVYGRWPGLAADRLDDGGLAVTTDYRSILAEVLTKRCGIGSTSLVFPGFSGPQLGLATARSRP